MSDNHNFDEHEDFYEDEDLPGFNRWKLIGGALAVVIVAGFGIGIWYAYDQGIKKGVQLAPPIIKADTAEVKKIPEDPRGMDIPHKDKEVFNVLQPEKEEKVEKLMTPPEEAVREAPPVDVKETVREEGQKEPGKSAETLMKKAEDAKETVTKESAKSTETAKVKTPEPVTKAAENPKPEPKPQPAPETAGKPAKKAVETAKATPTEKTNPGVSGAANYRVQLGAFRSVDAAEKAWAGLQKKHQDLLGEIPHRVQSVEIKGKGVFHRLQAGAFADKIGAGALCTNLKAQKQDCLVAKN
ncbi:MAG: SPOR domain-containing protein [Sneathiella sp.]